MDRRAPSTPTSPSEGAAVLTLRSPSAVRSRCNAILAAAQLDQLHHFTVRPELLPEATRRVVEALGPVHRDRPPPLAGRWRDFDAGGRDRWRELVVSLGAPTTDEIARARIDLALTSALLDADAGGPWSYHEAETGQDFRRHEGTAVATFRAFQKGLFSSRAGDPLRADAAGLSKISAESLETAFPGAAEHALHDLEARAALLQRLGAALLQSPNLFGTGEAARFGGLLDVCTRRAARGVLTARDLFDALTEALGPALGGALGPGGAVLGDVWPHDAAGGEGAWAGFVPIHQALQLAVYSLVEPLEEAGVVVADLHVLTGLPDAWSGGLFLDTDVLVPKLEGATAVLHAASSPLAIEWRALTVALIDRVAQAIRDQLGVSEEALPVGRLLPAFRAAGHLAAEEQREAVTPPLSVEGDGVLV